MRRIPLEGYPIGEEEKVEREEKGKRSTSLHTLSFISWSCCCKMAMSGSETTSDRVADPPLSLRVLGAGENRITA